MMKRRINGTLRAQTPPPNPQRRRRVDAAEAAIDDVQPKRVATPVAASRRRKTSAASPNRLSNFDTYLIRNAIITDKDQTVRHKNNDGAGGSGSPAMKRQRYINNGDRLDQQPRRGLRQRRMSVTFSATDDEFEQMLEAAQRINPSVEAANRATMMMTIPRTTTHEPGPSPGRKRGRPRKSERLPETVLLSPSVPIVKSVKPLKLVRGRKATTLPIIPPERQSQRLLGRESTTDWSTAFDTDDDEHMDSNDSNRKTLLRSKNDRSASTLAARRRQETTADTTDDEAFVVRLEQQQKQPKRTKSRNTTKNRMQPKRAKQHVPHPGTIANAAKLSRQHASQRCWTLSVCPSYVCNGCLSFADVSSICRNKTWLK